VAAVQFSLDYPSINCSQCRQNLEEDEIEPECDGHATEPCPVSKWDALTVQMISLHDRVCPWGELIMDAVPQAMEDLEISPADRRIARRCLIVIHRLIKKHQQQKALSE